MLVRVPAPTSTARSYVATVTRSRWPARAVVVAGVCALSAVACSSSAAPPQAARVTASSPSASPARSCPPVDAPVAMWPQGIPADLPVPAMTRVDSVEQREGGVTLVRFATGQPLKQIVSFIVTKLPAAGFSLGRGDAEPVEADAPFSRLGMRGGFRLRVRDECQTDGLLFVVDARGGGNPVLPATPPAPFASPFPTG